MQKLESGRFVVNLSMLLSSEFYDVFNNYSWWIVPNSDLLTLSAALLASGSGDVLGERALTS